MEQNKKDHREKKIEICFSQTSKNIPALNFYNQIYKAYEL